MEKQLMWLFFLLVFRGSRGRGKMPFKLVHDEKSTKVCQG